MGELRDCVKLRRVCGWAWGLSPIKNRARYIALVTGLLGAFLASGSGFGDCVRGASGARRSERGRLYIIIIHRLLIYTYTHSIYNSLDIIYII